METYTAEILKTACQWFVLASIITAVAVRYWQCRQLPGEPDEIESIPNRHPGGELRRDCDLSGRLSADVKTSFSYAQDQPSQFSRAVLGGYGRPRAI